MFATTDNGQFSNGWGICLLLIWTIIAITKSPFWHKKCRRLQMMGGGNTGF